MAKHCAGDVARYASSVLLKRLIIFHLFPFTTPASVALLVKKSWTASCFVLSHQSSSPLKHAMLLLGRACAELTNRNMLSRFNGTSQASGVASEFQWGRRSPTVQARKAVNDIVSLNDEAKKRIQRYDLA